jgi:uncharacterized protein (TIGR03067 family)
VQEPAKIAKLKTDSDLNPLRSRPDFKKLLGGLEEQEKLRGQWTIVSGEVGGRPDPETKGLRMTFAGNRFAVSSRVEVLLNGNMRLDPTTEPKAVDVFFTEGPNKGKTRRGIYALEGDDLKMCYSEFGMERPKEFTTISGTGHFLFFYRRAK